MEYKSAKEQQVEAFEKHLRSFIAGYSNDDGDDFQLPKIAARNLIDSVWPKKTGPWPARNKWWYAGPVWLQALNRRYKHLAPILNELVEHRHVPRLAGQKLVSSCFIKEVKGVEKRYNYVLLDINDKTRAMMAKRIGCGVRSIERYVNALAKCGVLKPFNLGPNGYFYSMAYWSDFEKVEDNKKVRLQRRIPFLNKETLGRLRAFESYYRD